MKIRPLLVVLLLLLAAAAGCDRSERLRNFGVVEKGVLYRSGRLENPALRRVIEQYGIKTIVDLGSWDMSRRKADANQALADDLGVTRYPIYMLGDGRANPNGYVAVLRILSDPAKQPVLVECAGGSERTSAAVVLFRHLVQGRSVQEAYEESFQFGHHADDYEWLAFLADWLDRITAAYAKGGFIEGLPPVVPEPGVTVRAYPAEGQFEPADARD